MEDLQVFISNTFTGTVWLKNGKKINLWFSNSTYPICGFKLDCTSCLRTVMANLFNSECQLKAQRMYPKLWVSAVGQEHPEPHGSCPEL